MAEKKNDVIQEGLNGILASIRARVTGGLNPASVAPSDIMILRPFMRVDAQVHRKPLRLHRNGVSRYAAGKSLINEDILREMVREEVRRMFDGDFGNRLIGAVRQEMERQLTLQNR